MSPYLHPLLLRGAGSPVGPYYSPPFQYMEFRKTMDIDHILDWQPPEVSQTAPHTPVFYRHTSQAASGSLGTMSEG